MDQLKSFYENQQSSKTNLLDEKIARLTNLYSAHIMQYNHDKEIQHEQVNQLTAMYNKQIKDLTDLYNESTDLYNEDKRIDAQLHRNTGEQIKRLSDELRNLKTEIIPRIEGRLGTSSRRR